MDKITSIANIIKLSLEFDKSLKQFDINSLYRYRDEIKRQILLLERTDSTVMMTRALPKLDKLDKINLYAIEYVSEHLDNRKNKKFKDNTVILFYSDTCKHAKKFIETEWPIICNNACNFANVVVINCNDPSSSDICKNFEIKYVPTVVYVTPTDIYHYDGKMKSADILNKISSYN
jgi:thiol-disulfide isomerase/thioredoxin